MKEAESITKEAQNTLKEACDLEKSLLEEILSDQELWRECKKNAEACGFNVRIIPQQERISGLVDAIVGAPPVMATRVVEVLVPDLPEEKVSQAQESFKLLTGDIFSPIKLKANQGEWVFFISDLDILDTRKDVGEIKKKIMEKYEIKYEEIKQLRHKRICTKGCCSKTTCEGHAIYISVCPILLKTLRNSGK